VVLLGLFVMEKFRFVLFRLTDVNVRKPDVLSSVGVQQHVRVVVRLVAQNMVHPQPRVPPVQPKCRFQGHQLQGDNVVILGDYGHSLFCKILGDILK
jgi:hypothetical protein